MVAFIINNVHNFGSQFSVVVELKGILCMTLLKRSKMKNYRAFWAKFVHDFIGHNIPIKVNYVFYSHPRT